jgi:antitoxin Phd
MKPTGPFGGVAFGLAGLCSQISSYDYSSHMKGETTVRDIQLKDAKASLSRLVDGALRGEEFAITRHGRKEAVVISWAAWERLSNVPSFGRLLASAPIEKGDIPGRDLTPSRDADL